MSERLLDPLDLRQGMTVGRYLLLEALGRGGMGVIWAAYDPQLDRKVALKVLLLGAASGRTRLLREAQALAKLTHPNVVTVHDVGTHADQVWIAMEFVDGQTLRDWIRERSHSWREVRAVMLDAGRGLAAAHHKGLVHRDFKPENVMIDREGRVRVMDFGLVRSEDGPVASRGPKEANQGSRPGDEPEVQDTDDETKVLGVDHEMSPPSASQSAIPTVIDPEDELSKPLDTNITHGGAVMGTPAYMAPEQHLGIPTDARADQFGFCVTLWEALHRQRPFKGTSLADLAVSVCEGRLAEAPRGVKVPAWLREVAERGLEPKREKRWPSMDELLDAMGQDSGGRWVTSIIVVVGLVLCAGFLGYVELQERRSARACALEAAALEAVWSPEVQAELGRAFEDTGLNAAADTWSRTRTIVDAWSEEWATLRARTCREGEVEGTRSAASLSSARECFDHHEAALSELLGALADVDGDGIHRAVSSASTLPSPASCVDEQGFELRLPEDPSARARVSELRSDLLRAEALYSLGRFDEVSVLADATLTQARALDWGPLEAESMELVGRALLQRGDYEQAEAVLEDSFIEAGRARHEELMVRAATSLARVVGDHQARHAEGLRWGRIAHLYIERAGLAGELDEASLETVLGRVHHLAGDYDAATAAYEHALVIYRATLGPEHTKVASVLNNVGNVAIQREDYDAALTALNRALVIQEATLGPEHPKVATVLNNMGNAYSGRGSMSEALAVYQRSLSIREAAFGKDHPDVATALNNLGSALIRSDQQEQALAAYQRALAIREASLGPDHPRVASTVNNLGQLYGKRGDHEEALAYLRRALAIRKASLGPRHPRVGSPLKNLGDVHKARGELDAAMAAYDEALEIYERTFGSDHSRAATTLQRIAVVHRLRGHLDQADAFNLRALAIARASSGSQILGVLELELGRVDEARGDTDAALAHFEASLELLEAWPDVSPADLAEARWAVARTLVRDEIDDQQRSRARVLAEQARGSLAKIEIPNALSEHSELSEIETWLAELTTARG